MLQTPFLRLMSSLWTNKGVWSHQFKWHCLHQIPKQLTCPKPCGWDYWTTRKGWVVQKSCSKVLFAGPESSPTIWALISKFKQEAFYCFGKCQLVVFVFISRLSLNAQRKQFCQFFFHINIYNSVIGTEVVYFRVSNYTRDFVREKLTKEETD